MLLCRSACTATPCGAVLSWAWQSGLIPDWTSRLHLVKMNSNRETKDLWFVSLHVFLISCKGSPMLMLLTCRIAYRMAEHALQQSLQSSQLTSSSSTMSWMLYLKTGTSSSRHLFEMCRTLQQQWVVRCTAACMTNCKLDSAPHSCSAACVTWTERHHPQDPADQPLP